MMMTEREGLAGIAMLAMYADGIIAAEEDEVLRERLLEFPEVFGQDDDALGRLLSGVERLGEELGPEKFLGACVAALARPTREVAYRIAAEIIVADGDVAPEENDYLEVLRDALPLAAADADRIHDAIEATL